MNGSYYNNEYSFNDFNQNKNETISGILKSNIHKKAKIYVTIPGSISNQDKVFDGIIEDVGDDYIVMSNPNGEWYLVLIIYLCFITFQEPIKYI